MVSFSNILVAYFLIGSVMVGGGAIDFQESGVTGFFIDETAQGGFTTSENATQNFQEADNIVEKVIKQLTGTVALVWSLIQSVLTFINWPVAVLNSVNAPPIAVVGLGGSLTAAFYISAVGIIGRVI